MTFGLSTMINNAFPTRHLVFVALLSLLLLLATPTHALTQTSSTPQNGAILEGVLHNSAGEPVPDVNVSVHENSHSRVFETKTDANGKFSLALPGDGTFTLTAEKSGFRKCVTDPLSILSGQKKQLDLLLQSLPTAQPSGSAMEFDDKPNFTVAGVTDWSGAGGHGSDTSLRTSEAFARETLALKPATSAGTADKVAPNKSTNDLEIEHKLLAAVAAAPRSFDVNRQLGEFYLRSGKIPEAILPLKTAYEITPGNLPNALDLAQAYLLHGDATSARALTARLLPTADADPNLHRLIGDIDEKSGDPLNAVREYERAATLDPSELNYFQWGSELLLHRAVAPSVIVFRKGSLAHPNSPRMRVGLGAALFAAGSYDDASRELCQASDLNPEDATAYLFLGKMDITSPTPFSCIAEKLARFQKNQPSNPIANYYLAMSIAKKNRESKNPEDLAQAKSLLERSVTLDPNFGDAWLQLGILYAAEGNSAKAVAAYTKAIEVTPTLSEPHYRLSQLYKRNGERTKAEQEIKLYKEVERTETDAVERQRREVQQFLVILKDQPPSAPQH